MFIFMSAILGHEGSVRPVFPCKNQETMIIYCVCTHMYRYTCMKLWMESTTDVSQKPLTTDFCEKKYLTRTWDSLLSRMVFSVLFQRERAKPFASVRWKTERSVGLKCSLLLAKEPQKKSFCFSLCCPSTSTFVSKAIVS